MRGVVAIGLAVLALAPPLGAAAAERDEQEDRWFGEDKVLHFGASCGIAYTAHLWTQPFLDGPIAPLVVGGGVSLASGVLKEVYDDSIGRPISGRDLVWDVIGTVTGLAIGWLVLELFGERPTSRARARPRRSAP